MNKKLRGEYLFLGAILLYIAYFYRSISGFSRKATTWPYILMALMLVMIVLVALNTYWDAQRRARNASEAEEKSKSLRQNVEDLKPILIQIASIALYIFLLRELGFLLCTFLFTFSQVWYFSEKKAKMALFSAGITTAFFYLLFDYGLNVRLPQFYLHHYFN